VSSRIPFFTFWLGTAGLILAAGLVEYRGYSFMSVAEWLTLSSALGSVGLTALAFRTFWKTPSADAVFTVLALACSPFVLGEILSLSGAEPNIHGAAIGGLYFYALLSEVTAITLLLSWAVRAMRR
jgi:hypothetical protein